MKYKQITHGLDRDLKHAACGSDAAPEEITCSPQQHKWTSKNSPINAAKNQVIYDIN